MKRAHPPIIGESGSDGLRTVYDRGLTAGRHCKIDSDQQALDELASIAVVAER